MSDWIPVKIVDHRIPFKFVDADHGISPAQLREELKRVVDGERGHRCAACREDHSQLREKVEALEQQLAVMSMIVSRLELRRDERLDAAMKRVEQLERHVGLRGQLMPARPSAPIDQEDV